MASDYQHVTGAAVTTLMSGVAALVTLLVRKGVITAEELSKELDSTAPDAFPEDSNPAGHAMQQMVLVLLKKAAIQGEAGKEAGNG